jgi:hypothetical protein
MGGLPLRYESHFGVTVFAEPRLTKTYPAAPAISPAAHAPCPHPQAMDGCFPMLSQ